MQSYCKTSVNPGRSSSSKMTQQQQQQQQQQHSSSVAAELSTTSVWVPHLISLLHSEIRPFGQALFACPTFDIVRKELNVYGFILWLIGFVSLPQPNQITTNHNSSGG